jgi:flagellar basal-body rod protein FlgG
MIRALGIAATGMNAQALRVDVIANNISNISTTGFKRARAEFADLMYQLDRPAGTSTRAADSLVPEATAIGLGVQTISVRNLHTQAPLAQTGNRYDLALNGRGWFQIAGPNGETLYSRAGAFNINATGQLVTADGHHVQPNIAIPPNATDVVISENGNVAARLPGQTDPQQVGQLQLATFPNEVGLEPMGSNLYRTTTSSGTVTTGTPGEDGFGTIRQGYLEGSNVDPVKEISDLIAAQRGYEMNSKVISTADEMASVITKSIR